MVKSKFIFCRLGTSYYKVYLRESNFLLGQVEKYRLPQGGYRWAAVNEHFRRYGCDHCTRNEAAERLHKVNYNWLRQQLDKANARIRQLEQALMLARFTPPFDMSQLPPIGV